MTPSPTPAARHERRALARTARADPVRAGRRVLAVMALALAGCAAAPAPAPERDLVVYRGGAATGPSPADGAPPADAAPRPSGGTLPAGRAGRPPDDKTFEERVDRPIRLDRAARRPAGPGPDVAAEGRRRVSEARRDLAGLTGDRDRLEQDDVTLERERARRARALSEAQREALDRRLEAAARSRPSGPRTTLSQAERTRALSEELQAEGRPDFGRRSRTTLSGGLPTLDR